MASDEAVYLRQITLELASATDLDTLLDLVLEYANKLIPFSAVNVCLIEGGALKVLRMKGYEGTGLDVPELESMYRKVSVPDIHSFEDHPGPILVRKTERTGDWINFPKTAWVRAYLGIPIVVRGATIGLISFDSNREDAFSEEDIEMAKPFAAAAGVALEKAKLIEGLEKALQEKEALMLELNHRVKNNLAIINSLINLSEIGPECSDLLTALRRRIDSIRIVHDLLYQSGRVKDIDIKRYIEELLESIFASFSDKRVVIEKKIEAIDFPVKLAVSLGLLINELALNAVKHAFPGTEEPVFRVELRQIDETGHIQLRVSNNGSPLPKEINLEDSRTLGFQLVRIMAVQLQAAFEVDREPITRFTFLFTM